MKAQPTKAAPLPLFDQAKGNALAQAGKAAAATGHEEWLVRARRKAIELAKANGSVTADDLQAALLLPDGAHDNLWGAVFRGAPFIASGYTKARRTKARGRVIRVWRVA